MTAHHAAQYSIPADWQQFQRLSVAVASAHFGIDFHSYGRNGQGQGGIDSYAYTLDGRLIAIQSKSKDGGYGAALSPGDVTKAVNKARDFKFKIDLFVILTSSPDDTRLRDAPINLSCSRGKLQFSRHLQRHWTKSDRKIMYGELFRPVLRVKREPHPYP